jgi:uncharacterized membrane protein
MIIPFPIAFFVSALATDVIYLNTGRAGFADASVWLLGAGLAGAALAAILGLTDFLGDKRVQRLRQAWMHMGGNVLLVLLEAVNLVLRLGDATAVAGAAVALSAVSVLLLLFNGWMGWEMVYRGHVGVEEAQPVRVRAR